MAAATEIKTVFSILASPKVSNVYLFAMERIAVAKESSIFVVV